MAKCEAKSKVAAASFSQETHPCYSELCICGFSYTATKKKSSLSLSLSECLCVFFQCICVFETQHKRAGNYLNYSNYSKECFALKYYRKFLDD